MLMMKGTIMVIMVWNNNVRVELEKGSEMGNLDWLYIV